MKKFTLILASIMLISTFTACKTSKDTLSDSSIIENENLSYFSSENITTVTENESSDSSPESSVSQKSEISASTSEVTTPSNNSPTVSSSNESQNNTNQTRHFIETIRYNDIPVYSKWWTIAIYNINGECIESIDGDEGYKPMVGLYALALGIIGDEEYYEVKYNETIAYIKKGSIGLKGDMVTAESDGLTFKLGDIIYHANITIL